MGSYQGTSEDGAHPCHRRYEYKEEWNTPGLVRTILFADGSTSQKYLLTVQASPLFLSYRKT